MGLKYPKALARTVPYDGERVWKTKDWFGSLYFGGRRVCVLLRPYSTSPVKMSFPWFIDRDRHTVPTATKLRGILHEYKTKKPIVLDGMLALENPDTYQLTWRDDMGDHVHPWAVYYVDDVLSGKEFHEGSGKRSFFKRRKRLVKMIKTLGADQIRLQPYSRIETKADFEWLLERARRADCQFILRKDVPYKAGKAGNILLGDVV